MRVTQVWAISLPPAMSRLAEQVARHEQRTKSELVREALRLYLAQRGHPISGGGGDLAHAGALLEAYRRRHGADRTSEEALREQFRGVKRTHDRLKSAAV
jgi:Arc/MetJ-type ribon-helix-helix transcriptional regulator